MLTHTMQGEQNKSTNFPVHTLFLPLGLKPEKKIRSRKLRVILDKDRMRQKAVTCESLEY